MKVEPTGIVMAGECEIQGAECTAMNQVAAITAVWEQPSRRQINVCRNCLDQMIRNGEWQVQGAALEQRPDIEVRTKGGSNILIVEVKRVPPISTNRIEWATRVRRNLLAHAAIPRTPFFMLAAWPGPFYLWSSSTNDLDVLPDFAFKVDAQIKPLLNEEKAKGTGTERALEAAVANWIVSLAKSEPKTLPLAIRKSGLGSELAAATVKLHPTPYGGKPN